MGAFYYEVPHVKKPYRFARLGESLEAYGANRAQYYEVSPERESHRYDSRAYVAPHFALYGTISGANRAFCGAYCC